MTNAQEIEIDCGCTEANGAAITNKITILLPCLNSEEGIRADRRAGDENDKEAVEGMGLFFFFIVKLLYLD